MGSVISNDANEILYCATFKKGNSVISYESKTYEGLLQQLYQTNEQLEFYRNSSKDRLYVDKIYSKRNELTLPEIIKIKENLLTDYGKNYLYRMLGL